MLVLGIDTSTKAGVFCIYDSNTGVVAEMKIHVNLNHSDTIMRAVSELFKLSGVPKRNIEMIAVGLGPGSFTGVRVGMGVAKGLAYSMEIPLRGVNILDVLAEKCRDTGKVIIPMLDARNKRVFYGAYRRENNIISLIEGYNDENIIDLLERYTEEDVVFVGEGALSYKEIITERMNGKEEIINLSQIMPDPGILCELAMKKENDNIYSLEPFYLVKSQAERAKEGK